MRIVIKIGTSTLAHSGGRMNIRRIEKLCKVLYAQATLIAGLPIEDPAAYTALVCSLMD